MPSKGSRKEYAPLPSTLERSEKHAQDIYEKTLERAEHEYTDDQERAHRAAWGAVKHSYEKVGDHWEQKEERGPSDPRSEHGGAHPKGESYGGVDINGHTQVELTARAEKLGLGMGRRATKADLADAINESNKKATRSAASVK